jgi:hypothetical protein
VNQHGIEIFSDVNGLSVGQLRRVDSIVDMRVRGVFCSEIERVIDRGDEWGWRTRNGCGGASLIVVKVPLCLPVIGTRSSPVETSSSHIPTWAITNLFYQLVLLAYDTANDGPGHVDNNVILGMTVFVRQAHFHESAVLGWWNGKCIFK